MSTDHHANAIRLARREAAKRLLALRAAARAGNPRARTRLRIATLEGSKFPNPDRRASCLKHAAQARAELADLEACQGTPDLVGVDQDIARTRQRLEVFEALAETAIR
ncbi:hypothetical protein [Deinococcus enclensis]|uniref:Uncharacterized protein n=1 Tax=Deinococcus enclensis TaxID=1049582 RepID=A0ABT9MHU9_9DEIO|nr:hypothetical protein [Deinococcus enclensis]MDP9766172.1 hypothetical protein [Deinococcus enclensis]